jgi:transcriptional accessory protein Tex/SPT6
VRVKVLDVDKARKRIALTLRLDDEVGQNSGRAGAARSPMPCAGPKDTTRVPVNTKAVTRDTLKKYCVSMGWMQEAQGNKARAKFSGMLNTLAGKKLIGVTDKHVWTAQ